jgi:Asp-tRNA(Asn)/Glu-tRNA(Gln) amidotransferase A subunit family amidase
MNDTHITRRSVLTALAGLGIGTAAFHEAIAAHLADDRIAPEDVKAAERIAGLKLTEEQRKEVAGAVDRAVANYKSLREIALANSVPPAIHFNPAPWMPPSCDSRENTVRLTERAAPKRPKTDEELAFLPVTELAALLRNRKVTSTDLTKLYLARLKKYDPILKCVVTLTEDLALKQAKRADAEIAAGRYRGPLHGIPWGAKDLIAVPGHPTTWGATPFKEQEFGTTATVVQKLEAAGAVLIAKLSLGALAMGDQWFGGRTNCPWNPKVGSSGSSAGSCAATAAGCVGFAIGSETLGSIVSPCRRNGTSGLRPTFGRVSRAGCMTLAWSMDKLGPIARSMEDCALIFGAIHGFDGLDPSAVDRPFSWPSLRPLNSLRVGFIPGQTREEHLKILRELGVKLAPIELPKKNPANPLVMILDTEAGAVFDELTRKGVTEGLNSWPRTFRRAQFIPAIEYLRANRVRTLLMKEMEDEVMSKVDCYIGGNDLVLTNLTGHPTAVFPAGFREVRGASMPFSVTFTGRLYGESDLLSVAHAFQQKLTAHLKRPPLERWLKEAKDAKE